MLRSFFLGDEEGVGEATTNISELAARPSVFVGLAIGL
jgi:hypothetical protein